MMCLIRSTMLISLYLISLDLRAQSKISLSYPEFPPFTYTANGKPAGIGIDLAYKVAREINIDLSLIPSPNYDRALLNTIQGNSDGFLLATENSVRNKAAKLSLPLVMNRWCWFGLVNTQPKPAKSERVGTILNTNTQKWLNKNGYKSHGIKSAEKLVFLLKHKRLKSVFIAEMAFKQALVNKKESIGDYAMTIERERDFGIYISHTFLDAHPNFFKKLNDAIRKHQNLGTINL